MGLNLMGTDLSEINFQKEAEFIVESETSMNCKGELPVGGKIKLDFESKKKVLLELMVHPGYMTKQYGGCTKTGDSFDSFSTSHEREHEIQALKSLISRFQRFE